LGPLTLVEEAGRLAALDWGGDATTDEPIPLLLAARRQLEAYFAGSRAPFDLPLAPEGSPADQSVWTAMRTIAYGTTRSYGDLARAAGLLPQEVGQACGRNPLPILIPCHRVVASDGALGGYSGRGGTETKRLLLVLEGALLL
jgi:methylated-DNA-[protein]-cysteine S-methyltransferase